VEEIQYFNAICCILKLLLSPLLHTWDAVLQTVQPKAPTQRRSEAAGEKGTTAVAGAEQVPASAAPSARD